MESTPCFRKVHWGANNVLFPGTRHTEPNEMFPWECVSEIIPGLFLTCEELAKDRENCLRCGYSLVMNFCAAAYNHPHRVYAFNTETKKREWRDFDSLQEFCAALDEYVSSPVPADVQARKVFLYNFAALDIPTYDISQHFLPCSAVIELIMACRDSLKTDGHGEDQLHSVVVHCMVGVSRSASVVAAYLMKRAHLGVEDTLAFMQSTRPVVGPNPGFRRQLGMWEALLTLHFDDEFAARLVIDELRERCNLVETVTELLPMLLENSKCATERQYFGFIVAESLESADQLTLIRRELLSAIAALVDSETYVDTPKFFAHICEIMRSAEKYVPSFLLCFADGTGDSADESVAWTDSAYRFVFIDLARSGYVKDTYDTARAFSSLMTMIQTKHFDYTEPSCARLIQSDGTSAVPPAPFIRFSFPFLHLVAAYAEGFVPYGELSDLQKQHPLSGGTFTESELEALVLLVRQLFLSHFLLSTCGGAQPDPEGDADGRWSVGSQLKHLEDDAEVVLFEELEKGASATDVLALARDRYVVSTPAQTEPVCVATGRKILGAIIAFRVLLETAEQFVLNSYSGRIDAKNTPLKYTEAAFPVSSVLAAATGVSDMCSAHRSAPGDLISYFRTALEPVYLADVIHTDGVWASLNAQES